jgi:hypothetical protein
MKLFEVDSPDSNLVLLLRNLISQADSQNQPSYLSWNAVNSLMQNVGEEQFDYDSFKASYDSNPQVQSLVQRFDGDGIELKTKTKNPKAPGGKDTGADNVSKMAKAATARRQNESEIREMAALFEALALRQVMLKEGRLDEAGVWNAVKSAVGKGVAGVKSANDAINRLGQLAQNTAPVQDFDNKVEGILKNIGSRNPQVAEKARQYGEWAKKNPIKQGLIIGMLTAIASLVAGPAGGAAAGAVLRAGNELLKGEKASTAIGKSVKGAAFGWLAGMGVRALGDFAANMHISMNPIKGIRDLMDINLDYQRIETGSTAGAATGRLHVKIPADMANKVQSLFGQGIKAAQQGDYATAQNNFNAVSDYFSGSKYKELLDSIIEKNNVLQGQKDQILAAADQMREFAKGIASAAQGAVTGASAAAKTTAPQAKTTAQRPVVAPDKRAELEKKRADMQKRLRQQGKIKQ